MISFARTTKAAGAKATARLGAISLLTLWLSAALGANAAAAEITVDVTIGGATYTALLDDRTERYRRASNSPLASSHYSGRLHGEADSWTSMSRVGDRWHGIVSLNGALSIIDAAASANASAAVAARTPGSMEMGTCTVHRPAGALAPDPAFEVARQLDLASASSPISASAPVALPATYAENCTSEVDGVCLLAELEMVFDQQFQQDFPTNFTDQAATMLNLIEGYYRNDLDIAFDALSMTFPSTPVFSTTTNADDLLDDIRTRKDGNQLPFIENRRALLHVVTGRDFDSTTAGIAYLGVVCGFNFNAGLSRLTPASNPSIAITALVAAHEIGHNFGAVHDTEDNSCGGGFIMAASVNPGASSFSSCSLDEIISEIDNNEAILDNCFNYPIDIALAERAGNPTSATAGSAEQLVYDLTVATAGRGAGSVEVTGQISAGAGAIDGVTVNGSGCSIASDNQSYSCSEDGSNAPFTLVVDVTPTGGNSLTVSQSAVSTGDANLRDIIDGNSTASSTLSVTTPITLSAPSSLSASGNTSNGNVSLSWNDSNSDENGFRIERNRAGAGFVSLDTVAANQTTYTDPNVERDVAFAYRVIATAAGITDSPPSNTATVTVASPPPTSGGGSSSSGGGGGGSSDAWFVLLSLLAALGASRRRL